MCSDGCLQYVEPMYLVGLRQVPRLPHDRHAPPHLTSSYHALVPSPGLVCWTTSLGAGDMQ
jgi:hypothetical protein